MRFLHNCAAFRRTVLAAAVCLLFCAAVFSQEPPPRISGFSFDGLKRTKEFVIQRDLQRFIGMEISDSVLHDIETVLQSENLFTDISLEAVPLSEAESDIRISLNEKISILPIPIVAVTDGSFAAGAFFLDSNAMGMKNTFVIGGLFSAKMLMGTALFARPASGRVPGITVYTGVAKKNYEITDTKENELFSFDSLSVSGQLRFTEKFGEAFSAGIGTGFSIVSVDSADGIAQCIESVKAWENCVSLSVSVSDWNGTFMSEKSASAEGSAAVTACSDAFYAAEAKIRIQHPVTERLRFIQSACAFCGFDTPVVFYRGGSSVSVRLFPDDFVSERLAGISAGLEYALLPTRIGLVSVYGVYQAACAKEFDSSLVRSQGAGGGLRLYLSKIAFPACAFEMIYNMTEQRVSTGFSLGISF